MVALHRSTQGLARLPESLTRDTHMFNKILIAHRGENGRAADVSTNGLPQPAQRASTRHTIA